MDGHEGNRIKKNGARPLKNAQFCSRSRKAKISTTGIYSIFRGLKLSPDAEIGQKGAFCKGLGASGG
jgi:fumarylacetoacetate (FAA) hydrolase family protein